MARYLDLTHEFRQPMPVFPGDPAPSLTQIASIAKDGYTNHQLTTSLHVGTHLDAPWHMVEGGKTVARLLPNHAIGRGVLIDARGQNSIGPKLLAGKTLAAGDIVLVLTGWGERFGEAAYFSDYPELNAAFAQRLVENKINAIGVDTPSPDRAPYAVHRLLLGHDILIMENLAHLDQLLDVAHFEVIALPLKLQADAAPVRVVAKIL